MNATNIEIVKIIIEFIKTLTTWPVVILIISLVFTQKFKTEIANLINRLKSLGMGSAKADFEKQQQQSREEELEKKAKELEKELAQVKTTQEQERLELLKVAFFEATYNVIFKSQIELLRNLKKAGNQGLKWSWIMTRLYPITMWNYPFNDYMIFLQTSGLITWTLIDNAKDAIVKITSLGDELLDYLNIRSYTGIEKTI